METLTLIILLQKTLKNFLIFLFTGFISCSQRQTTADNIYIVPVRKKPEIKIQPNETPFATFNANFLLASDKTRIASNKIFSALAQSFRDVTQCFRESTQTFRDLKQCFRDLSQSSREVA